MAISCTQWTGPGWLRVTATGALWFWRPLHIPCKRYLKQSFALSALHVKILTHPMQTLPRTVALRALNKKTLTHRKQTLFITVALNEKIFSHSMQTIHLQKKKKKLVLPFIYQAWDLNVMKHSESTPIPSTPISSQQVQTAGSAGFHTLSLILGNSPNNVMPV